MKTMKHFYLEFTKKRFIHLFLGMSLLLMSSGMMAQKTSVQSGPWTDTATWGGNPVPNSSELVTIAAGHTVTFVPTVATTIGSLSIEGNATLNITGANSRNIGNITVASNGTLSSIGASTSLRAANTTWTNNGSITIFNLGYTTETSRIINNNGLFTISSGIGSTGVGVFNNNSGATLTFTGTIAGTINNFGTMNASTLTGSAVVANINNKATGVLNYTGGSMSSNTLVLDAYELGNTVNYNSTTAIQTIRPTTYYNLVLSGINTFRKEVAVSTAITIASGGVLTVNEGTLLNNVGTITNNGELLLKSSALGSAILQSTSSISGVTQQRYLSSNQRGWRLLSNPLSSKTFNTLAIDSGITVGNNFTGEYASVTNTWSSTDGSAVIDTQKAYKVFITGLTGQSPDYPGGVISNVTLVNKGTAANTAPATINTVAGQYYLIANPYTAPISMIRLRGASTGLSATVAYYDPTNASTDAKVKAGGYNSFTLLGSTAGSATDVVIPAMGAIFVQATTAGTINIPATNIFTGTPLQSGTYNHKSAQSKTASTNALKLEVNSDGIYYDALALQFKTVGDVGSNIDFGKLPNSILDAYSISGTKKMAVSELELAVQTIPLGITSTIQKSYTFKVVDNTIPVGFEAVLVDKMLNTDTVLTPGTNYNFGIDSTPASQGDARFAINLRTAGSLDVKDNELDAKIQVYPNPSRGQFNISNALDAAATIEISSLNGQVLHTQKLNSGTTTIQTKSWATGVYILKATKNGSETTKKLLIQ